MTHTIYIDNREDKSREGKANRAVSMLSSFSNAGKVAEMTHLEVGDVVCGKVAVELKEVKDLMESINSKKGVPSRLFPECYEMSRNYEQAHLIILGTDLEIASLCGEYNITFQGVLAALASVSSRMGVHVNNFSSIHIASTFMDYTFEKANDGKSAVDHVFVKRKTASKYDELVFLVASYPKVSTDRARKLLDHFGTVKNIINATEAEIMEIDGFGKKIAEIIVDINNREFKVIENE